MLQGFRLGDFLIHPPSGTVRGPDGDAHLSPTCMEVLQCLASQPLEIVEHERFLAEVWPDRDAGLAPLRHCISELRHAFDDHRDNPRFIQTLPGRGYRLLLEPLPEASAAPAAAPAVRAAPRWSLESFIAQLRKRRVAGTAISYIVAGWVLLQVLDVVCGPLQCPAGTERRVILAVVALFPVALLLAWVLQWQRNPDTGRLRPVAEQIHPADLFLLSTATVAASAFLIWSLSDRPPAAPPLAANSIAVMPFADLSPTQDQDYLCKGIAEEIIHKLTRLRPLKVASRTDTFSMPPGTDIGSIAERLSVEHVLEGSVRRAGEMLRVTAQLIDTRTRFHVWSQDYEREFKDVFAIQDDIAAHVVATLDLVLDASKQPDRPANLDAYEAYLKGRDELRKRTAGGSLDRAQAWFEAAIAADPGYASAHAGLCETYLELYEDKLARSYFEAAESACDSALELGSPSGPVHVALGNLYRVSGRYHDAHRQFDKAIKTNRYDVDAYIAKARTYVSENRLRAASKTLERTLQIEPKFWRGHRNMGDVLFNERRWADAIPYYELVVQQQPHDAAAWNNLGAAHFMAGDFDNALADWRRALEIDPGRDSAYANIGSSLFYSRRFEEAARTYRRAIDIAPEDFTNHGMLAGALWHAGNTDEATRHYQRAAALAEAALEINPNQAEAAASLAIAYAALDRPQRAREMIARARRLAPRDMYTHYDVARALVLLGESDAAVDALRRAVELGYPTTLIPADAALDRLQQEPSLTAMLKASAP